jgi:DNA-binding SARP family transcriptional activator
LLSRPNQVVTVDQLVDSVWGDRPPASAVANVRTHVASLRRRLPGTRIVTRPTGYLITVAPGELDVAVFADLVAQAGRDAKSGQPAEAAWRLRRALALWRGRPMANVPHHGATEAEAARLDEMRLIAVQDCLGATLAAGEPDLAAVELRSLVLTYPLRERLWALLMLALCQGGRRADALDAYEQARARLADELGIDPGPELRQLRHRILTGDPVLLGQR